MKVTQVNIDFIWDLQQTSCRLVTKYGTSACPIFLDYLYLPLQTYTSGEMIEIEGIVQSEGEKEARSQRKQEYLFNLKI